MEGVLPQRALQGQEHEMILSSRTKLIRRKSPDFFSPVPENKLLEQKSEEYKRWLQKGQVAMLSPGSRHRSTLKNVEHELVLSSGSFQSKRSRPTVGEQRNASPTLTDSVNTSCWLSNKMDSSWSFCKENECQMADQVEAVFNAKIKVKEENDVHFRLRGCQTSKEWLWEKAHMEVRLSEEVNQLCQQTADRGSLTDYRLNSGIQLGRDHRQEYKAMEADYHNLRQQAAKSTLQKIKDEEKRRAQLRSRKMPDSLAEADPVKVVAKKFCTAVVFNVVEDLKLRPWKEHKIRQRIRRLFHPTPPKQPRRPTMRPNTNSFRLDDRGCMEGRLTKFSPSAPSTPPPEYISPFPKRGISRNGRTLRHAETWHAGQHAPDSSLDDFGSQKQPEWTETWQSAQVLMEHQEGTLYGRRLALSAGDIPQTSDGIASLNPGRKQVAKKRPLWNARFFIVEEEEPIKPSVLAEAEEQRAREHLGGIMEKLRRASYGLPSGSELVNSEDYEIVSRISSRLASSRTMDLRRWNLGSARGALYRYSLLKPPKYAKMNKVHEADEHDNDSESDYSSDSGPEYEDENEFDVIAESSTDEFSRASSSLLSVEAKDFAKRLLSKASKSSTSLVLPSLQTRKSSFAQLAQSIEKSLVMPNIKRREVPENEHHKLPLPDRLTKTYEERLPQPVGRSLSPFA